MNLHKVKISQYRSNFIIIFFSATFILNFTHSNDEVQEASDERSFLSIKNLTKLLHIPSLFYFVRKRIEKNP